jgi:hypothetical protein
MEQGGFQAYSAAGTEKPTLFDAILLHDSLELREVFPDHEVLDACAV